MVTGRRLISQEPSILLERTRLLILSFSAGWKSHQLRDWAEITSSFLHTLMRPRPASYAAILDRAKVKKPSISILSKGRRPCSLERPRRCRWKITVLAQSVSISPMKSYSARAHKVPMRWLWIILIFQVILSWDILIRIKGLIIITKSWNKSMTTKNPLKLHRLPVHHHSMVTATTNVFNSQTRMTHPAVPFSNWSQTISTSVRVKTTMVKPRDRVIFLQETAKIRIRSCLMCSSSSKTKLQTTPILSRPR